MKKKKLLAFICFIMIVSVVSALVGAKVMEDKYINDSSKTINKNKGIFTNRLSMMLENESGQYVATTAEAWPTTGYKFNSKLSKCANGGKVSWDFANKRVKMEGTTSDKCFIYFDKMVTVDSYCEDGDNLADCIKTYGNQGYDKSSIYIHDSNLTNGAGDGSYRFAGASDYVNNFVCFGSDASTCPTDNLYRIIGVFGEQVKLIKYDYTTSSLLGTDGSYINNYALENSFEKDSFYKGTKEISTILSYYWNSSGTNTWSTSNLNILNLNNNYYNSFSSSWRSMIATTSWNVGGNSKEKIQYEIPSNTYQNEIVSPDTSVNYQAKIGLVYVSDYGFSVDSSFWNIILREYYNFAEQSWMYMGLHEWTITRGTHSAAYIINHAGMLGFNDVDAIGRAIRPVFYLKSSIKYGSGKGTKENPIRLGDFEITLANVVKEQYTGTQGENGIYLHNGTVKSGETVIDANDGSYRYAGANPNNFVCFGSDASTCPNDNLYRIIGVFGDQVKLIKYDYATSTSLGASGAYSSTSSASSYSNYRGSLSTLYWYYWNKSTNNSIWSESNLSTVNLNGIYLTNLGTTWTNKIKQTTWKVGGNNDLLSPTYQAYQNEIVSPSESTTYSAKIGLMYVSDYGYAASSSAWTTKLSSYNTPTVTGVNWMYMGLSEWTISRRSDNQGVAFYLRDSGYVNFNFVYEYRYAVRPCFYLNSNVTYISGNGTSSLPYRIA